MCRATSLSAWGVEEAGAQRGRVGGRGHSHWRVGDECEKWNLNVPIRNLHFTLFMYIFGSKNVLSILEKE